MEGDVKTDVLIIGGGMAGLLCAYELKNRGVDYVLVEKDAIAQGITKNTTAKITSQHGIIYSRIADMYGKENARKYLDANEQAIKEYQSIAENIDCDFEIQDAYTYSLTDRRQIENEVRLLNSIGYDAEFATKTQLPFDIKGAIKFSRQAQFNPLKFVLGICKDLNIYENTFVKKIENGVVITNRGKIQAEKIIVCTHFPLFNKHGSYFLKLYQHRSYVCAVDNLPIIEGMYVDEDIKGMSFRKYKNMMLIGGGGHRTGKSGGNFTEIENFIREYYPLAKIKYSWATQDAMSLDGLPYIGLYSKNTPDLYVATGFNKWGMSTAMTSAKILSDMVLGKRNEYSELFSPQRKIIHPQLFVNGVEATVNLLTPTVRRCPHLGCALKWNKSEHTWDCPCHGSRFTEDGKVIDNPAKRDADV
ncbi:MAG: FAD-dependent oxidoreductase [Clostridia bacterium]|nr:FAD-dependent oxidoreductase [Clostridia bacterium]